jgi:alpha-tubulin suppressor-like RCC1 family protein
MLGDNSEGQLGIGAEFKPYCDRPCLITSLNEDITQVSCGYRHTLMLTENGKVYGMGSNRRNEIGIA